MILVDDEGQSVRERINGNGHAQGRTLGGAKRRRGGEGAHEEKVSHS
jgi:hypothetical protein